MPSNLADQLKLSQEKKPEPPKPQFFDLTEPDDQDHLNALLAKRPDTKIIDTYESQLLEYFILANPHLHINPSQKEKEFTAYKKKHYANNEPWQAGNWIYLSWRQTLLHILDDEQYQVVRTGRNRNLITANEQKTYYHSTIGIAGLSVGNSIALSIVLTGGGKNMKLADPDTLELTNLNRIRGSVTELTEPKVYMTARQIYELDPYANLTLYPEGITEDNLAEFFNGLDIIIDEVDNLGIKIHLRDHAKQNKIPLLSAVDNGDSGILDIERHDQDDNIPYFNGRVTDSDIEQMTSGRLPLPLVGKMIGEKLVGFDITEPRMQDSLLAIGDTIPTWPQLGGAALLNGVATAAATRAILLNQPLAAQRAVLSLPGMLVPGYNKKEQIAARAKQTKQFEEDYNARISAFLEHTKPKY